MRIKIEDEDLRLAVVEGIYQGKYKKYRSNKTLHNNLNKAIQIILCADSYATLVCFRSLGCEALTGDMSGKYSLRLGFREKYRLIFELEQEEITILLLEISEHYGDH